MSSCLPVYPWNSSLPVDTQVYKQLILFILLPEHSSLSLFCWKPFLSYFNKFPFDLHIPVCLLWPVPWQKTSPEDQQDGVHRCSQLNEPVTVRGTRKPAGVSTGSVQLIFISAGPVQLIFVSAGPAQRFFVPAGPAQLIFAGSAQFCATRAPPGTPGFVNRLWGEGLEPGPRACSSPAPSGADSSQVLSNSSAGPAQLIFFAAGSVQHSRAPTRVRAARASTRVSVTRAPTRISVTRAPTRVRVTRAPTRISTSGAPPRVGSVRLTDASAGSVQLTDASAGSVQLTDASAGSVQLTDASAGSVQLTVASAGSVQLIDASAGSAQLTDASAGSAQLTDASSGPVRLTFASTGSVQLSASRAPPRISASRTLPRISASRAPHRARSARVPSRGELPQEIFFGGPYNLCLGGRAQSQGHGTPWPTWKNKGQVSSSTMVSRAPWSAKAATVPGSAMGHRPGGHLSGLQVPEASSNATYSAFRLYIVLSVCVFPGNWTHNLLRCWRNALPLSHRNTYRVFSLWIIFLNVFIQNHRSWKLWKIHDLYSPSPHSLVFIHRKLNTASNPIKV